MRLVAKKVSLTQPAPIQVDSTEPEVIELALEQIPGRAIVNSVNLEAGRDKLDRVTPIAMAHGAALIALTIDEVGMGKTRERKLEIAQRIHDLVCDEHGMDPQLLIFDALTFTLTTGDEEWRPSAVETIEGIRADQGRAARRAHLARRLQRLVRHRPAGALGPELRLPAPLRRGRARPRDGQPEPHHAVRGDRRDGARARRRPRVQPARGRARALHRPLRGARPRRRRGRGGRPDRGHGARGGAALAHPAPQEGRRRGADRPRGREARRGADAQRRAAAGDEGGRRQVRRRRADPPVRAPERRGDEARRRAARALPRQARGLHEGHRRARDGVRRRARHRQVARQHDPHQQRLHGRRPRQAGPDRHDPRRRARARRDRDRAERAARLDLQADAAVRVRAALARAGVPAAGRRRGDQPQVRAARELPGRQGVRRRSTSPASSTARTRSRASP